jgi:hypothetical protein
MVPSTHWFVGTRIVFRELVRFLGQRRAAVPGRSGAPSNEHFLTWPDGGFTIAVNSQRCRLAPRPSYNNDGPIAAMNAANSSGMPG